jgi:hypothetical protein
MSTEIHAVKTMDGWRYWLWQNTADVYFTEPLNEEEVSAAYLEHAIRQMTFDHKARFKFRLRRVREKSELLDEWKIETDHEER